jgi:hypothetical protein
MNKNSNWNSENIHVILCGTYFKKQNKNLFEILNNEYNENIYKFHDINEIECLIKSFDNMINCVCLYDYDELPTYENYDIVYIIINNSINIEEKYYSQKYKQLATYYGLPCININCDTNNSDVVIEIIYALKNRNETQLYAIKDITQQNLSDNNITNYLFNDENDIYDYAKNIKSFESYLNNLENVENVENLEKLRILCANYLMVYGDIKFCDDHILVKYVYEDYIHIQKIYLQQTKPLFKLLHENDKQKIYIPLTGNRNINDTYFISLNKLAKEKLVNLQLMIEIINRNEMTHTYNSVNLDGIISSKIYDNEPKINIITQYNLLINKPYVEFYLNNVFPELIYPEIASYYINIEQSYETSLKLFMSIIYYYSIIKSFDINNFKLSCCLNNINNNINYIQDISIKCNINLEKINNELILYFNNNQYSSRYLSPYIAQTEYLFSSYGSYGSLSKMNFTKEYNKIFNKWLSNRNRNILLKLNISKGLPRFPFYTSTSTSSNPILTIKTVVQALDYLNICGDIIVNDLDKELTQIESNEEIIIKYGSYYKYYVCGIIDDVDDIKIANNMIEKGIKYVVIEENGVLFDSCSDSCSDSDSDNDKEELFKLINLIPSNKLIIDIVIDNSINTCDYSINNIINVLNILLSKGIHVIRLCIDNINIDFKLFIQKLLPYFNKFVKVIINSIYITSINDVRYLWNFNITPELDNVIWKRIIPLEKLVVEMTKFDNDGMVQICIQDINYQVKDIIRINRERLENMIINKKINDYNIITFNRTIYNDAFLITVNNTNVNNFIINTYPYDQLEQCENSSIAIERLNKQLENLKISEYCGCDITNIIEKYWNILCTNENEKKISIASDIVSHLLKFFYDNSIKWNDIVRQLNKTNILISSYKRDYIIIGITKSNKTHKYINDVLGIQLIHYIDNIDNKNKLYLEYKIVDEDKFNIYFDINKKVTFMYIKSNDIVYYISSGFINGCITFNTNIDGYPKVASSINKIICDELRLCLIKRKDEIININTNTNTKSQIMINNNHINIITQYLHTLSIEPNMYQIIKYRENQNNIINNKECILMDKIIDSNDNNLKNNNLVIWKTVLKSGQITFGLYEGINKIKK